MFRIREAHADDLEPLLELARLLDTVNLPNDRQVLERIVELSGRSFSQTIEVFEREYLFVLEDLAQSGRIIGTCMIHAQHGTRKAPHIFFEVLEEEKYSATLDRHFIHRCLRIGYNYAGPTEIGGLILLPEYRGRPEALGKLLSYVRFLFIGMYRDRFRGEVLSELLPPLEKDGTSLLWESLGRIFTGLSYQEADRLSKDNKEFIRALFPEGLIYTSMLPEAVQKVIGVVGPQTRGVEKMLKQIGFSYAHRIDPFDGGPHFVAATEDIKLVSGTKRARVVSVETVDDGRPWGIVARESKGPHHFVAVPTRFRATPGASELGLPESARTALGVTAGDEVAYLGL
jgi:arginine N-succinyltransferase